MMWDHGTEILVPLFWAYLHFAWYGMRFAACKWLTQLLGRRQSGCHVCNYYSSIFSWGAEGILFFSHSGVAILVHQTIANDATFLELALMFARTLSCKSCAGGCKHAAQRSMSEQHFQTEPHLKSVDVWAGGRQVKHLRNSIQARLRVASDLPRITCDSQGIE